MRNEKRLLHILQLRTDEMLLYCKQHLIRYFGKDNVMTLGTDCVMAKGQRRDVVLCAHIDTVWEGRAQKNNESPKLKVTETYVQTITVDDRAGCAGIFDILDALQKKKKPLPSVVFFNGEESGGIGAHAFCDARTQPFVQDLLASVRIIIELDRKGLEEAVVYSWIPSKDFWQFFAEYGFFEGSGTFTDISILTDYLGLPSVNLSIGYYHAHTAEAVLYFDGYELCINRVIKMLLQHDTMPEFEFISWYQDDDDDDEIWNWYYKQTGGIDTRRKRNKDISPEWRNWIRKKKIYYY